MTILSNIYWAFNQEGFKSIEKYNAAIHQYQADIVQEKASWHPNEIIIQSPVIEIGYEAWVESINELQENETLIDDEAAAFDEDNSDDGLYQVEICATLQASNGEHFTALELMYALQKQLQGKELGDHIFFEGLSLAETESEIPFYFINLGS